MNKYVALWDTGATNGGITQAVIDTCALVPTGMVAVRGVHGPPQQRETYLVNIYLPNNVAIMGAVVTRMDIIDANVLIGMDIITAGDFAVTNFKGRTKFTFRMPSQAAIDFVQDQNYRGLLPSIPHGGQKRPKKKK